MEHNWFFPPHGGIRLSDLAGAIGATLENQDVADRLVRSVSPVYRAKEGDVCYMLSRRHREELETCQATAIICDKALAPIIPSSIPILLTQQPHAAFAIAGNLLHPAALRPSLVLSETAPARFPSSPTSLLR